MKRLVGFRPQLVTLEDRVTPGSMLSSLQTPDWMIPSLGLTALANEVSDQDLALSRLVTDFGSSLSDSATLAQSLGASDFMAPLALIRSGFHPTFAPISASSTDGNVGIQGGDVVNLGVLDGSSIRVGSNDPITFGANPPVDGLDNVSIGPDGTLFGAKSDIHFRPATLTFSGVDFMVQFRAQSDANGTYDRGSGSSTSGLTLDVKITSAGAPGFNNNTCIIPATDLTLTTDDTGGAQFSGGVGTVVDNNFAAPAIPHGACGSFPLFGDYADRINGALGLPSDAGNNNITLVIQMDPPLTP